MLHSLKHNVLWLQKSYYLPEKKGFLHFITDFYNFLVFNNSFFEVGLCSARSTTALTISCHFFEPPPATFSVPRLPFCIKAGDDVVDCQSVIDRRLPSASVGAGRGVFFIDGDINGERACAGGNGLPPRGSGTDSRRQLPGEPMQP